MINKSILGMFLLLSFVGCNNSRNKKTVTVEPKQVNTTKEDNFIGGWIQPNPINKNEVQGFELLNNGDAKSINFHTLLYKKWWVENKKIYFITQSIGNSVSSTDTIAYDIIKINKDSLIIKDRSLILSYRRK